MAAIKHLSGNLVAAAFCGFPLELAHGWNFNALASECEIALSTTVLGEAFDPQRLSDVEIRDALAKLSRQANDLKISLSNIRPLDDRRLVNSAFKYSGIANFIGFLLQCDNDYVRLRRICTDLEFVSDFLKKSVEDIEQPAPKWRDRERRRLNIWRAEKLIPIFESAFATKISVNGWPSDPRHRSPTPFMSFVQRINKLAFDQEILDLAAVLKEARKARPM